MRMNDFESLSESYSAAEIKSTLDGTETDELAKALMGASPSINRLFVEAFPELDFKAVRERIGSVRIEEVENAQDKILSMFKNK